MTSAVVCRAWRHISILEPVQCPTPGLSASPPMAQPLNMSMLSEAVLVRSLCGLGPTRYVCRCSGSYSLQQAVEIRRVSPKQRRPSSLIPPASVRIVAFATFGNEQIQNLIHIPTLSCSLNQLLRFQRVGTFVCSDLEERARRPTPIF